METLLTLPATELARLVREGLVDWRDAHARAVHVDEFESLSPGEAK